MVENGLEPFRYKSSTIVRHGPVSPVERRQRVCSFLEDLATTSITWAAIVCTDGLDHSKRAASVSVSVKKAITTAIDHGIFSGENDPAVLLHDGKRDSYSSYDESLRKQLAMDFDPSFQQNICPVYPVFLQDADRTYPQSNAADYIAGYLRSLLVDDVPVEEVQHESVYRLDPSWVRSAGTPTPLYELESLRPIREQKLRTRVLCWLLGRGTPPEPEPTGYDPFVEQVEQISDSNVGRYLLDEF
ncbi:hypothetical protein [Halorussus ruber]|uniref:hypothetical protein n=1 Tax=Halorussus ruber TaxID=1126238 RepID=UPI001091B143|nr:hypothetical protein [Halorussus ruber]